MRIVNPVVLLDRTGRRGVGFLGMGERVLTVAYLGWGSLVEGGRVEIVWCFYLLGTWSLVAVLGWGLMECFYFSREALWWGSRSRG